MFFSRPALGGAIGLVAVLLALAGVGCRPDAEETIASRRIAVLPFENLSGHSQMDWVSLAVPAVLEGQITGSQKIHIFPARAMRDAYAGNATRVVHGYYDVDPRGRIELRAVLEDLSRSSAMEAFTAEGPPAEILSLVDKLARRIDPQVRPYSTASADAVREFANGLGARDPGSAISALQRALERDPSYGPAYLALAQRLAATGDVAQAKETIARGLEARVSEIDRARLALLSAEFENDPAARDKSISALAALVPADASMLAGLANSHFRAGRYKEAASAYEKVLAAEPGHAGIWNQLGYAQAYSGNFEAARQSIEKYRTLAPGEPNPLDSLGDIHLYFGRLEEAARYYLDAARMSPQFLNGGAFYKAAEARWLAGDVKAASVHFREFLDLRREARDPFLAYREAQWDYLSGRRRQAVEKMMRAARSTQGDPAALAAAELSMWLAAAGDRDSAETWATFAARAAASPNSRAFAIIAQSVATGNAASSREAQAWTHLLAGRFKEAEPLLAEMAMGLPPDAAARIQLLRAWALVESGRVAEAARLVAHFPIPPAGGEAPLGVLALPRFFSVRAKVLEQQGKADEAKLCLRLFRQYTAAEEIM